MSGIARLALLGWLCSAGFLTMESMLAAVWVISGCLTTAGFVRLTGKGIVPRNGITSANLSAKIRRIGEGSNLAKG